MPTRADPSPASDEQVRALLERYKCPVPFHEVRTRFLSGSLSMWVPPLAIRTLRYLRLWSTISRSRSRR
jgi:hypothetical protein